MSSFFSGLFSGPGSQNEKQDGIVSCFHLNLFSARSRGAAARPFAGRGAGGWADDPGSHGRIAGLGNDGHDGRGHGGHGGRLRGHGCGHRLHAGAAGAAADQRDQGQYRTEEDPDLVSFQGAYLLFSSDALSLAPVKRKHSIQVLPAFSAFS